MYITSHPTFTQGLTGTAGFEGGSGGLWFDGVVLVDYDGVFELPEGVTNTCKKLGFNMSYVEGD